MARGDRVAACFPNDTFKQLYDNPAHAIRVKYQQFGPNAETASGRRWNDAEQFLEFLDRAALASDNEQPTRRLLASVFGSQAPVRAAAYSLTARRLLAAECHEFLLDADPREEERWAPYRRWIAHLGEHDTVVSFNYDLVIETASRAVDRPVHVALPGKPMPSGGPILLKLHGSVDWMRRETPASPLPSAGASPTYERVAVEYMLNTVPNEIVIASPGPTKHVLASGELAGLWNEAVARIRRAMAIVFVGYRFPPSDSAARRTLLDAIAENDAGKLILHTVLGPDIHDPHTRRLTGLLESALRRRNERQAIVGSAVVKQIAHSGGTGRVVPHPLFAQDFFDTYRPGDLRRAPE